MDLVVKLPTSPRGPGHAAGPTCPDCGADALVTVVSETGGGGTRLRRFCRECDRRRAERAREDLQPIAQSVARLLLYGGFLLALLTATADHVAISGRPGFGWRQLVGSELGFLAIVLGLLLRKGLLGTAGVFLLVLSIGADLLEIGHVPGFGWRSYLGFICAAAMIAAGTAWRRALAHAVAARPAAVGGTLGSSRSGPGDRRGSGSAGEESPDSEGQRAG
jgi:hypothetical protein